MNRRHQTYSSEDSHVIAVDEGDNTEKAFLWACQNYPRNHRFIITHGRFSPSIYNGFNGNHFSLDDEVQKERSENERKHQMVFDKYQKLCTDNNRYCNFQEVNYVTPSDLGTKICQVAKNEGASGVVCSSREPGVLNRGTVSTSILSDCDVSVTVVKGCP